MSNAARVGDISSGHDFCRPVEIVSGSQKVFINGKAAARVGDILGEHDCLGTYENHAPHVPVIATGSQKVFIDGRAAARVGDSVSCGVFGESQIVTGSENIFFL